MGERSAAMTLTPVIIDAAINGSKSKAVNPNVPITPDEIVADALAAFGAGAAIVHNHTDRFGSDPEIAARYLEAWRVVLAERPDALVYPTVSGGARGEISYRHLLPLAESGLLRMAPLDPGSLNLAARGSDGVPTGSFVYQNSFDTISEAFELCRTLELGPSIAIYEPGWLRTTLAWWKAGRLPRGAMLKFYLATENALTGSPFGLPPTATALDAYLELLDDCPLPWAVSVVGGDVVASDVTRLALERGSHLHLGLEVYGGDRTPSNAELIAEAVDLCAQVGRPVASSEEAAVLLDLPPGVA
jgi:3-keto-5-aminohexanoate cleavage enzyme